MQRLLRMICLCMVVTLCAACSFGGGNNGNSGNGGGVTPVPATGARQVLIWNCTANRAALTIWLLDSASGQWQNLGEASPGYASGTGCGPTITPPFLVTFAERREYGLVAIDATLIGCNDPNPVNLVCRRWSSPVLGDPQGVDVPVTIG